jgi:hypothetical protein
MPSDLKAKLTQVAARIAATQERLRGLERSAASVRHDLDSLCNEVERTVEPGATPVEDEWGHRVPTRPMAVGGLNGREAAAAAHGAAGETDGSAAGPREVEATADDEPRPGR